MARLVRVFKGQWIKSQEGVWTFEQDPNSIPHDILVGRKEQVDGLKDLVRGVFGLRQETPMVVTFQLPQWMLELEGETLPPHNINTTADVDMLMSVHDWNVDPRLCVIFGSEDVATYQFRCRRPFTIGNYTFLAEGVTEEQHMATVLDIIRSNEILCSDRLLTEMFDEDKMVLLYRFSLEIEKAKNSLDLNLGTMVEVDDHIVPNVGNGGESHIEAGSQVPTTNIQGHVGRGDGPFNNPPHFAAAMRTTPVTGMYGPTVYAPSMGSMDVRGNYWENLMTSRYAVEVHRIYGVPGSENVGYFPTDLNIGNPTAPTMHGSPNGLPLHMYGFGIDVSSTASSTEVKTVEDTGETLTAAKQTGTKGLTCVQQGESSTRGGTGTPELDINVVVGDTQDPGTTIGKDAEGGDA